MKTAHAQATPPDSNAALVLENMRKTYAAGNVEALKGLNMTVKRGDFFALLGNNGAGKSTVLGIIAGLVQKTSGKAWVMGIDIDKNHALARSKLGLVPQEFNFSHFEKIYDIVLTNAGYYGINPIRAAANTEKYLRQLNLWDKRKEISRNLSGGMKRRLMIVRALVHEPELLILDEPTAGVDVQMRHETWDFLRALNEQGTTILLTTHYLEEAETLCRNLAMISDGIITASGSMHDILTAAKTQKLILETDRALTEVPELPPGFTGTLVSGELHLIWTHGESLNTLIASLEKQGLQITALSEENSRLEELFLSPPPATL